MPASHRDIDTLRRALDSAFFELGEAFQGLPDTDVWTRAHPRLLSVGELAAHIAEGEASTLAGHNLEGPLLVEVAGYYTAALTRPMRLDLGAADVLAEALRVHEACMQAVGDLRPAYDDPCPHRERWTWGYALEYMGFHVAYHTGQIYSVRHLLGHGTADN